MQLCCVLKLRLGEKWLPHIGINWYIIRYCRLQSATLNWKLKITALLFDVSLRVPFIHMHMYTSVLWWSEYPTLCCHGYHGCLYQSVAMEAFYHNSTVCAYELPWRLMILWLFPWIPCLLNERRLLRNHSCIPVPVNTRVSWVAIKQSHPIVNVLSKHLLTVGIQVLLLWKHAHTMVTQWQVECPLSWPPSVVMVT